MDLTVHIRPQPWHLQPSITLQLLITSADPRRALVCFQRQVEAQCDAVAPRPCSVYVASDSGAVSSMLTPSSMLTLSETWDGCRCPPQPCVVR